MARRRTAVRSDDRTRTKVSTTVARETYAYLRGLVDRGDAHSLADALDLLVRQRLEEQRRTELERRMAAYYETLADEDVAAQRLWGAFAEREMAGGDES